MPTGKYRAGAPAYHASYYARVTKPRRQAKPPRRAPTGATVRVSFNVTPEMEAELREAAQANQRSLSAEINARLSPNPIPKPDRRNGCSTCP